MPHVVLLGDSIFDNAAYVRGGPDVVAQLREALPAGWEATLRAVDGAVTTDVERQLARLPADATHLVLSVGGNDALGEAGILQERASSAAQVLGRLADMRGRFAVRYREALDGVLAAGLPVVACTIYEGSFPDEETRRLTSVALAVFNDAILRLLVERGMDAIDLRLVCDSPRDYANPIEPSVEGGRKIARAIVRAVTELPPPAGHSRVIGG
jgi:hypothetical protein